MTKTFERHEYEQLGKALIRNIRQRHNLVDTTSIDDDIKGLKEAMRQSGIKAGIDMKIIREDIRVLSLDY